LQVRNRRRRETRSWRIGGLRPATWLSPAFAILGLPRGRSQGTSGRSDPWQSTRPPWGPMAAPSTRAGYALRSPALSQAREAAWWPRPVMTVEGTDGVAHAAHGPARAGLCGRPGTRSHLQRLSRGSEGDTPPTRKRKRAAGSDPDKRTSGPRVLTESRISSRRHSGRGSPHLRLRAAKRVCRSSPAGWLRRPLVGLGSKTGWQRSQRAEGWISNIVRR
jgi:hypothetical protein